MSIPRLQYAMRSAFHFFVSVWSMFSQTSRKDRDFGEELESLALRELRQFPPAKDRKETPVTGVGSPGNQEPRSFCKFSSKAQLRNKHGGAEFGTKLSLLASSQVELFVRNSPTSVRDYPQQAHNCIIDFHRRCERSRRRWEEISKDDPDVIALSPSRKRGYSLEMDGSGQLRQRCEEVPGTIFRKGNEDKCHRPLPSGYPTERKKVRFEDDLRVCGTQEPCKDVNRRREARVVGPALYSSPNRAAGSSLALRKPNSTREPLEETCSSMYINPASLPVRETRAMKREKAMRRVSRPVKRKLNSPLVCWDPIEGVLMQPRRKKMKIRVGQDSFFGGHVKAVRFYRVFDEVFFWHG